MLRLLWPLLPFLVIIALTAVSKCLPLTVSDWQFWFVWLPFVAVVSYASGVLAAYMTLK